MTGPGRRGLNPSRSQLSNGTVILAKESRVTPAVTLHAQFSAGSAFDPPALGGVAHFVSRTIDRGTRTRSADQIADDLDNRGVSLAVTINRHVLSIVCTCLVEDLEPMLRLLGDVAMNPVFPDADVATRRGEIVTLIRQDEDSPAAMANEALMAMLYGEGHPYGRPPRGTFASVEATDRAALSAFHAARFKSAGLSLAMVGDVEPARAIDAATAVFGAAPPAMPEPPVFPSVPAATNRRARVIPMMNKAQADIAYGFTSILRADPAYYAYMLMNNVLGQYSIGGRLGDRIREKQGMAYYVFSSLDANVVPGPLIVRAGVSPANVDRAIRSIDEELTNMMREGPTEKELDESRQYLIGSMPRNLETNLGIANFLQTAEFFGLGLDHDLRLPGLLQAVSLGDVHDAARRVLDPARAAVVVAGPYSGQHAGTRT
ncbi:MAG: pitrilysin family protein [Vicinamibacterales bacterium]